MAGTRFCATLGIWFVFISCGTVLQASVIPDDQAQHILHELTELKDKIDGMEMKVNDVHEYMFGNRSNEALISGDRYYVPDEALTASDSHHVMPPKCSRKGVPKPPGCWGKGWHPEPGTAGDWIQVDLGQTFDIHAVATQGRAGGDQWTLTYKIGYLQGGQYLLYLDEQYGGVKIFRGNYNTDTVITNAFLPEIRSRVVRLYPLTWHHRPTIRWELYGKVTRPNGMVPT